MLAAGMHGPTSSVQPPPSPTFGPLSPKFGNSKFDGARRSDSSNGVGTRAVATSPPRTGSRAFVSPYRSGSKGFGRLNTHASTASRVSFSGSRTSPALEVKKSKSSWHGLLDPVIADPPQPSHHSTHKIGRTATHKSGSGVRLSVSEPRVSHSPLKWPSSSSGSSASAQGTSSTSGWRRRKTVKKWWLEVLMESWLYHIVSMSVTLANALMIGGEQTERLSDVDTNMYERAQYGFKTFYVLELVMRYLVHGIGCLSRDWVKFDTILLFCDVLGELVVGFVDYPAVVFRLVRLAPLVRVLHSMVKFRVLKVLVLSLLGSAEVMIHTTLLIVLFLYTFSILGVGLILHNSKSIGPDVDDEFRELASRYFGSISGAMMTLTQFVCNDSIGAIYRPFVMQEPILIFYFLSVTLVMPFVLVDLVTGVIVSNTHDHIEQEKKQANMAQMFQLEVTLQGVFTDLDKDENGMVSRWGIVSMQDEAREALDMYLKGKSVTSVFDVLDTDKSGTLDAEEFCDGIWSAAASDCRIETQRTAKQVGAILGQLKRMEGVREDLHNSLGYVLQKNKGMLKTLQARSARSDCSGRRAKRNGSSEPRRSRRGASPQ